MGKLLPCCEPGGACYEAGLADVGHRYEPSDEVKAIADWLRREGERRMAMYPFRIADEIEQGAHLK